LGLGAFLWAAGVLLSPGAVLASSDDTDRDALIDQWEIHYFGSIEAGEAFADDDGDGLSNLVEQELGSNPLVADVHQEGRSTLPSIGMLGCAAAALAPRPPPTCGRSLPGNVSAKLPFRQGAICFLDVGSPAGFVFVGNHAGVGLWIQVGADSF